MKKFFVIVMMSFMALFLFVGCRNSSGNSHSVLTDPQIQAIAKSMNEEINFMGRLNEKYNLQYSNFKIESDDYNRYIVSMHYQYEDSNRNYQSGDVIVYFRWIPETEEYLYSKTNISFPMEGNALLTEEKLISHIKSKEDFGWGTNPDSPSVEGTAETDISTTTDGESVSIENKTQSSAEGNNFNSDDNEYTSLDYLKCNYLSQMIKHELLSAPGTNYASVYDDATITDCCGNWYEIRFSAEVYRVMSRLTDKVICYAWAYSSFDFENEKLADVQYESFFNAPYKYFYITYKLADEGFTDVEIQDCKNRIGWGAPVSRDVSSEVSLWGTIHANEYHTDFWLDESVLIQIGDMQYDISRIEIDDPYLFPTMISGKPISECDGEHLFLTGTITSASEDFSLVKFYTLREAVLGEDIPYSVAPSVYETEIAGHVQYNEETTLCDIVLNEPTELIAINGHAALTETVRIWPADYYFANDSIMNYVGQDVQIRGILDYEFGVFSIRPTAVNKQTLAEEQLPLHKCIFCGGTARLTSGAWCCDDCYAVYGEEDFAEKVSFDAFKEGTWWDTYSQRCNMTINVIDNETVTIEINWSSSASENTQWIITGKWDSYWGLLRYEERTKQDTLTSADGHTTTNVSYDDGNGFFYFNSGYLYWVDYKESAGFDCIFEFPNF